MIAKLDTLPSPTLAASSLTAQLRGRLPTQLRRGIPMYMACVVLVLLLFNLDLFRTTAVGTPSAGAGKLLTRPPLATSAVQSTLAPVRPRTEFPNKIWQVWKVPVYAFEERDYNVAKTWTEKNPEWRYEVLTDGNEMKYVEFHFGSDGFNRPDIVEFYRVVKAAIVKADLLRYMIMYAEGGIYADIDVEALKPLTKFIPPRYDHKDIDMVVGVEIDEPDWKDHPILGPKSRSFCQWTFMCKPQLPVMMRLIEQIMTWLTEVAKKQNVPIGEVELDFDEIISGTGPSAFTNAIIKEMSEKSGSRPITWDMFHDLSESRLVSGVLVLTVEAFAAGQGHSDSGNHDARAALVKHHYHASNWPSRHPRYHHPAYAEVEKCNWDDRCIHAWDDNVANFEKLSDEEQKKIIAEKEAEWERIRLEEEENRKKEEERRAKEEERRKLEEAERRIQEAKVAEQKKKEDEEAAAKRKSQEEADKKVAEPKKEAPKP